MNIKYSTFTFTCFSDMGKDPADDMPIITVMVGLSSLLVIIFIIIILYMLRLVTYSRPKYKMLLTSFEFMFLKFRLHVDRQVQEVQAGRKSLELLQTVQREIGWYR